MGQYLSSSLSTSTSDTTSETTNGKQQSQQVRRGKDQRKHSKAEAKRRNAEWEHVVDQFTDQVLDSSFLALPVRASTVQAASQYTHHDSIADTTSNYLLPGSHKHLGGAYDATDGCIYGVPANSKTILCLFPNTKDNGITTKYEMKTIPLPSSIADCNYKWLRGIFAHGYLWAIPSWADRVLCVDIDAYWGRRKPAGEIVQLLPLPEEHVPGMQWQWHGAGMNQEQTAIYCIPSNAHQVLKVDLQTKTTSLIPIHVDKTKYPDFTLDSMNKWYGGILGADNCVYGIPYRSCAVLRIDCAADSASLVGPNYGCSKYNWHGGIQVKGKIYAHPSHADTVLVIDTRSEVSGTDDCCSELAIKRADYDTDDRQNYKWLGGAVGVDGNIYCPACDTSSVLKIDTTTNICTTFGFAGKERNKWQGGLLGRDGCVYCIPASGRHVLRISTFQDENEEPAIQLLGDLPNHKDKWQGGSQGKDGSLYFIPENGYRVLKVTPPKDRPTIVNGQLPENDVIIEMM